MFLFPILIISSSIAFTQNIPESERSKSAIERVRPELEVALKNLNLRYGSPIFIRIFKESNELELWIRNDQGNFTLFQTHPICYFSGNLGPKLKEGDCQAPEGFYNIMPKQLNPQSNFHLSMDIGYPNNYDRFYKRTGGDIFIHGNCVSIGCFAMTDSVIEKIYALADAAFRNGHPFFRVHIFPFRMTAENILQHADSQWMDFWRNLKEGYDYFEQKKMPPNVTVRNYNYKFQ
jgi:murein L,D-transpeptidase YafK